MIILWSEFLSNLHSNKIQFWWKRSGKETWSEIFSKCFLKSTSSKILFVEKNLLITWSNRLLSSALSTSSGSLLRSTWSYITITEMLIEPVIEHRDWTFNWCFQINCNERDGELCNSIIIGSFCCTFKLLEMGFRLKENPSKFLTIYVKNWRFFTLRTTTF